MSTLQVENASTGIRRRCWARASRLDSADSGHAAAFGCGDEEPIARFPRGSRVIPDRQCLAAVAELPRPLAGVS
jgi:hypothetical protein